MVMGVNPHLLLHGILMVVAWIIFATAGIFQARYMKNIDKKWFIWHAMAQLITLALTTVGIALSWRAYVILCDYTIF
jgi:ribose/xylose/arabinose/galactoside ABC-type transport system permease subunit